MDAAPPTLEALVDRYDATIRAFLMTLSPVRQEDLDDLTQDVYTRFVKYQLVDRYDPTRASFTTYLYQACFSVAANAHRTRQRRPQYVASGLAGGALEQAGPSNQEWPVLWKELLAGDPALRAAVVAVQSAERLTPAAKRRLRAACVAHGLV